MKHLELAFRQELKKVMNGLWLMTIHEDGLVNPGVPDVSYVMNGDCETGWLELKAIEGADKNGNYKFTLEPSQYRWINNHFNRVPVHILCATDTVCWLVPGDSHRELINAQSHQQLSEFSIGFQREQLRHILHSELTRATDRRKRCGLFGV